MPFFDSGDPTGGGLDPNDPRVIRRLAALGLGPGMPMQPPSVSPMPMPVDATPPSQSLQRLYAAQPPSVTSQGLAAAVRGTPSDYSDAPRPYVSPRDMMRQYGITDLTPPPPPQVNPAHGFWGKLGQHLLGAAEGAGSQRGLIPMLIGGIAGGVRPQLGANAWYQNATIPRWQQQMGAQQELGNRRLGQIAQVGALTGIDPTTGQPTYAAQQATDKADAQEQYRQMQDQWKQQHEKLERDVAEGKISQAQAALDAKMMLASMQDQYKQLEFSVRLSTATTAEEKVQIQRERLQWEQQKAQEGSSTFTHDTYESVNPANDPANAAKIQQIYNEEGSKANNAHWAEKILNPTTGKMEPNPIYNRDYDAKGDPEVQRKIDRRIAAEIGKPTEKKTGTITERVKGGVQSAGQPASQPTNPAKVFPKSMLPKYMTAHPEYRTPEEAMKHIQDTGYTVQ